MHWLVNVAHNDEPASLVANILPVTCSSLRCETARQPMNCRDAWVVADHRGQTARVSVTFQLHPMSQSFFQLHARQGGKCTSVQVCKFGGGLVQCVYIAKSSSCIEQTVVRPGKTQNPASHSNFITAGVFGLILLFYS